MKLRHKLTLDLVQRITPPVLHLKQGDCMTREVLISLTNDGAPWFPKKEDLIFQIVYCKTDNTGGCYDTLPDGTVACTAEDHSVLVQLHPQMLTAPGLVICELRILDGSGAQVSTFAFFLSVEHSVSAGIKSEDYYRFTSLDALRQAIGEMSQLETEEKSSLVAAVNELSRGVTVKDAVLYSPQTLSAEAQTQVRQNIGASPVNHRHSYNDLTDKPTIPAAYTHPASHPASMIRGLASVATSGSYSDLKNTPVIPTIPDSLPANGGNADTVGGKTVEQIVAEATGNMPTGGGETAYALVSDLAELQAALAAGAKHIHLAVGADITVNANLTLPAGITLMGNGACLRRATGFEDVLLYLGENCRVQDLTIYGNRTAMASPTWSRTIEISTLKSCVLDNVSVVDGNEAIVVYGDDCIVMNCNITNCGGNGIHFSGANRVRVENCTIIGANKRSGMGHEDGCIIWSNECQDIVCTNNYCEDGLNGFGSIDSPDNSNVKLIGNTVKNCTNAIDIVCPADSARNIIIEANHFVNSGRININATENRNPQPLNGTIANNVFESTSINMYNFSSFSVTGNFILNGCLILQFCANVSVFGNTIDNTINEDVPLYLYGSKNITVDGNRIRGWDCLINLSTTSGIIITNNDIRHIYLGTKTGAAIRNNDHCKNLLFCNNRVAVYEKPAITVYSYNTVSNNIFIINDSSLRCLDAKNYNENTLAIGNRVVGTVSSNLLSDGTTRRGAYNDLPAYDDVFVECAMNLANCTSNAPAKITLGDSFTCTLTANSGYSLPALISGTNNGVALTANDYEYDRVTGTLTVYAVMGELVINAGE